MGSPEMHRMPRRKGASYPSSELGGCCVCQFERWSECWIRPAPRAPRHERGASPLLPQSQVPVETAGADRERAAAGAAIAPSTAPAALSVRRTPEPIRSPARSGSGLASARSAAGSVRPKPANFPTFMRGCYRTPSGARAPSATNFRPKKSNAGAGALAFTLYPTLTSRREVPSPHGRR